MERTRLQFRQSGSVRPRSKKASWLGVLAGLAARLSRRPRSEITRAELQRHDFATSTQRIGVRFSERIRKTFRFRWLRRL